MASKSPFPPIQQAIVATEELEDGWLFIFDSPDKINQLGEFINRERKCCTFLNFDIVNEDPLKCRVVRQTTSDYDLEVVKEIIKTLFS